MTKELPITLSEFKTEVLPKLEKKGITTYNDCVVIGTKNPFVVIKHNQGWAYNLKTGNIYELYS